MTAFGVGFGLAGVVSSLHDPVGLMIALAMLLLAALHEWACRKEAADMAANEAGAAAPIPGSTFAAMDQMDLSGLDEMREMERAMEALKGQVCAVIDGYALAYPDPITMFGLLTQVGNVVLASTGDDIRMQVTLNLDSQAGRG
jgi:hypothetical protein